MPTRLVDAALHEQAQLLRARWPTQLLALEQYLPVEERTEDAGIMAARLVAAINEFHTGDGSYDGEWLERFFPPELVAARLAGGDALPPFDDLLAFLGIGGAVLGAPVGFQTVPSASPSEDLDAALAAMP